VRARGSGRTEPGRGSDVARMAVVGGSVAGCAAAVAGTAAGYDVVVHERTERGFADRGFGIAVPPGLLDEWVKTGYLDPAMPFLPVTERAWLHLTDRGGERELWRQPMEVAVCNWYLLWRSLRARVERADYRSGSRVDGVHRNGRAGGATIVVNGEEHRYDLVVGADGHRSVVRGLVAPQAVPEYAGYALWRGCLPESALSRSVVREAERALVTVVFPGGHGIFYLMPATDGGRLLNWGVYMFPPAGTPYDPSAAHPPGADPELAARVKDVARRYFPARWAQVVESCADSAIAVQPMLDLPLPRYAAPGVVLAGDAGALTRPHTASGAVKAIEDARCLERALRAAPAPEEALSRYDAERRGEANRLTALGRRIGRAQVEQTPDWQTMGPVEMAAWARATLSGTAHYLYRNTDDDKT
jgi:2-polyprenyl-6-methoxyphenol hydroxylase-like FAD-dependent oxidoreductase